MAANLEKIVQNADIWYSQNGAPDAGDRPFGVRGGRFAAVPSRHSRIRPVGVTVLRTRYVGGGDGTGSEIVVFGQWAGRGLVSDIHSLLHLIRLDNMGGAQDQ